jgi:hypothetical protein
MGISGVSSSAYSYDDMKVKPQKPQEPTPPPGGNIENRQPPAEPLPPSPQIKQEVAKESGVGSMLDIAG